MGIIRIILAISVISIHSGTKIFGISWFDAFLAVQAFFMISGFYMALVLNGKYGSLPLRYFYRSRALRIYPTYIVGVILMLAVDGSQIRTVYRSLSPLTRAFMVGENLTIFGQDISYIFCMRLRDNVCAVSFLPTIIPPAWSLSVELGFYLIAPFIVRNPRRIIAFIGIGTIYHLLTIAIPIPDQSFSLFSLSPFSLKYYFYPSSFVFFGLGALSYHKQHLFSGPKYLVIILFLIAFACIDTPLSLWMAVVFAFAIPEIFKMTKDIALDRAVGEYSYPLYILHWPILTFVQKHLSDQSSLLKYLSVGTIVTIASAVFAFVVYVVLDRPLDRLRHPPEMAPRQAIRISAWSRTMLIAGFVLPFVTLAAIVFSE